MFRKQKKFLASLLSLTLLITSVPTQIFANQVEPTSKQQLEMQGETSGDVKTTTPPAIDLKPGKYVEEGYEVEFKITHQELDTFAGEMLITNTGEYDIENWNLKFYLQNEIIDLKNAKIIDQNDNNYVLEGMDEFSSILKGQTVTVNLKAKYDKQVIAPTEYTLEEKIDFENYPQDEEDYKIWKQKIIKKLQRKQNNNTQDLTRLFATQEPTTGSINNQYVKFNYLNGCYGLFTTGGNPDNPNDNDKKLLYGNGGTSYTTIRIDGVDNKFSPDTVTRYDNKIIGTKRYNDVIVSQHIGIIPNQYTGRDDVVEFFYTVENTSNTPHDVGVRIMFDTMLGYNDAAPFRLPAIGDVTTETDLFGEDIPEFWQAFDSLSNPSVIAQGTLKVDKASTPNRVRFTNWGSATGNPWDYTRPVGSSNGDSAVCLYWNEQTLEKDDTLACKTFYGLSALQQDLRPPLAMALSGATKIEVVKNKEGKEEYSPNPFTVTAYIQNIGTGIAVNSKVKINLPKGMEVIGGNNVISLGNLPVGTKQHQISWKVKISPSSVEKIEKYSVTVQADNAAAKTLEREIKIPKLITTNLVKVQVKQVLLTNNNALDIKLININQEKINLEDILIKYYYNFEKIGEIKGVCNNVFINKEWKPVNRKIKITSKKSTFEQEASGVIDISVNQLNTILEPNQEMSLQIDLKGDNIQKNSYSGKTTIPNTDPNSYVDWDTINVISKKDNSVLWGIEPQKAGKILKGQYYDNNKVIIEADRLGRDTARVSGEVKLNNTEVSLNSNEFKLKGNLKYDGTDNPLTIQGNLTRYENDPIDRAWVVTENSNILSCSIEKIDDINQTDLLMLDSEERLKNATAVIKIALLDNGKIIYLEDDVSELNINLMDSISRKEDTNRNVYKMNYWYKDYLVYQNYNPAISTAITQDFNYYLDMLQHFINQGIYNSSLFSAEYDEVTRLADAPSLLKMANTKSSKNLLEQAKALGLPNIVPIHNLVCNIGETQMLIRDPEQPVTIDIRPTHTEDGCTNYHPGFIYRVWQKYPNHQHVMKQNVYIDIMVWSNVAQVINESRAKCELRIKFNETLIYDEERGRLFIDAGNIENFGDKPFNISNVEQVMMIAGDLKYEITEDYFADLQGDIAGNVKRNGGVDVWKIGVLAIKQIPVVGSKLADIASAILEFNKGQVAIVKASELKDLKDDGCGRANPSSEEIIGSTKVRQETPDFIFLMEPDDYVIARADIQRTNNVPATLIYNCTFLLNDVFKNSSQKIGDLDVNDSRNTGWIEYHKVK